MVCNQYLFLRGSTFKVPALDSHPSWAFGDGHQSQSLFPQLPRWPYCIRAAHTCFFSLWAWGFTLSQGTRSGKTTESLPHGAAIFQRGIGDETCYLYLCLVLRCPSGSSYSCSDHLFKKQFVWGRGWPFARDWARHSKMNRRSELISKDSQYTE